MRNIILSIFFIFQAGELVAETPDSLYMKDQSLKVGVVHSSLINGVILGYGHSLDTEYISYKSIDSIHYMDSRVWINPGSDQASQPQLKKPVKSGLSGGLGMGLSLPHLGVFMSWFNFQPDKKFGIYADFTVPWDGIRGGDDYYDKSETWAGVTLGDSKKEEISTLTTFHLGSCYALSDRVVAIGGVGMSIENNYAKYYDPFEILTSDGNYYVNSDRGKVTSPNLTIGLITTVEGTFFQAFSFTFSTPPFGVQAGLVVGI